MIRTTTMEEWQAEAAALFGPDEMSWRFICPCCKHVAAVSDWQAAGAPESAVAFSCVGRWLPDAREAFHRDGPGPCDYAGGGLMRFNPVKIEGRASRVFEFDRPKGDDDA